MHHRRGLRHHLRDDALLQRLDNGFEHAGLDTRRLAMLRYVDAITRSPGGVTIVHLDALRAVGFEDRDILGICEVAAYYAYVNRIADGLGVQVEPWAIEDA